MKPPLVEDGYCAATDAGKLGDCAAGSKGCFAWPLEAQRYTQPAGKLRGLQACIRECLTCARCNFVSFSRVERDCSWYFECDLRKLHNGTATGHSSVRVRDPATGGLLDPVRQFMEAGYGREAGAPSSPPRLVDVVVYGGPHHDLVLEARMHELDPVVSLFVVAEHLRPGGGGGSAAAFSTARTRFAPFANRTRHVVLPASEGTVPEFVDLELQDYGARQRVLNSWQVAYRGVAQPDELVLVSDADEVPRRVALARLLRDASVLSALADSQAYALHGPTFDYHLGCRARRPMDAGAAPRLLSGEALLHYGGGNVRDYTNRIPFRGVPDAAWHFRYWASAEAVQGLFCRHPRPRALTDAASWWDPKPVATAAAAFCAEPERIRRAAEGCLDLFGRAGSAGRAATPPPDEELPASIVLRQRNCCPGRACCHTT